MKIQELMLNQNLPYQVIANEYLKLYNKLKGKDFKAILLFDLDEVLALLTEDWLDAYNVIYKDNLKPHHLDIWDTHKKVKPECGFKIYDILKHPGLFRNLKPTAHSQEVLQRLVNDDYEIFIVSDSPVGNSFCDGVESIGNPADDKRKWVWEQFPMINPRNIALTGEKFMIHGNVLVDDKPATYDLFTSIGRDVILVDQPYNQGIQTDLRAKDLLEVEKHIRNLFEKQQ